MRLPLQKIDAHAHIQVGINPRELITLDAIVFAVTGEEAEWQEALARDDQTILWGIGCHPGLASEVASFSAERFHSALKTATLVGEVGLDGRSPAPMSEQRQVFRQILHAVAEMPRPITIHSRYASGAVLDALEEQPQAGAILHWWRGSAAETARAIELGCFFSINGAEGKRPKVLEHLAPERVLTETDYPHSRRSDPKAARPADVETIESALERAWGLDRWGVRQQLWRNLERVFDATDMLDGQLPDELQRTLLAVPTA